MVRTIDTATARAELEHLIDQARDHGDSVIIERNGRPAAALVPVELLERQRQARAEVLRAIDEFQAGIETDLTDPEIERLIDQEVAAVRRERTQRQGQANHSERDPSGPQGEGGCSRQ